jgi:hypothetical protein
VLAVVSLLLWFMTQDVRLPMVLVDEWSIVFALLLLIEFIGTKLTFNRKQEADEVYAQ